MTGRFVVIFRFATGRKTQVEGARFSDGRRRGNPPNCFPRVAQDLTDFNSWLERFERDAPDSMSAWTEAVRACHELECIAVFGAVSVRGRRQSQVASVVESPFHDVLGKGRPLARVVAGSLGGGQKAPLVFAHRAFF